MVVPERLKRLAAYVPTPVAHQIYHRPRVITEPATRRFPAAVLLTDISGFTLLSELLGQAGPTGAEELTRFINRYFTRMIQVIQTYRGQIIEFSGDAIIALFPAGGAPLQVAVRQAGECALAMQAVMSDFTGIKTSQGPASLSMKVAIGAGKVLECRLGGVAGQWEYLVGGDPLVQVASAERYARPGQIVLSAPAWAEAKDFFNGAPNPQNSDFYNLYRVVVPLSNISPAPLDWTRLHAKQQALAEKALQCYVPRVIKARLDEQAGWLAELRRMTILFVGIGGIDYEAPEAGHRLQSFLQATQELVLRFEGTLAKMAVDDKGTVLLLLFGVPPFSHEDDAARAVAFALNLQAVAQEQNLRMAIGITEGQVFAGPVGAPDRREYTVIGDEVNLAARLMQYGRARTIIISERVKERAGPQFITESLGNISVKGKTLALPAYVVKGERGAHDQFMTRYLLHQDPLIGRKAELEQTRRIATRAKAGELQLLLIEGDLGLGKSRLVSEMAREWVADGNVGYGSKCISYGRQIPYQGWQEILMAMCGLRPDLPPRQQLDQLARSMADLEPPPGYPAFWTDRLPLLGDVLGLEIPENDFTRTITGQLRRNNIFALVEALVRRQVERRPLLIVLEDIHWADELSLSLVAHLTQTLFDMPLLLVLAYRPSVPGTPSSWLTDLKNRPFTHLIQLNTLSREESSDLVKIILDDTPVSPDAQEIILGRGQGNPFFLHEICRAIIDVMATSPVEPRQLLEKVDLPDSVHDALLMRVDRLPEAEKLTLKIASVIGVRFQRPLLEAVHPMAQAEYLLPTQLQELENENLICMEVSAPKWEYVFRNEVTREIVYEGLLLAQRRQLHGAVGAALEKLAPDEVESLAFHFSRSDNTEMALHYLKLAGQKASREYANHTAIGYYSDILTCLAERPSETRAGSIITPEYWDVLQERVKLYNLLGERYEESEDLGTLGLIAEALGDDRRRAMTAKQWANFYETIGDYISGVELAERVVQLAQQAGDEKLVGEGYNQAGKLLYRLGQYETAELSLQRAWHIAQKYHDVGAQADCLGNLGLVAYYQADYEIARYFFKEAVELWRDLGDHLGLGNGLRHLGQVYYMLGQYMDALHCYEESLALHSKIGDRAGEALTRHYLAQVQRSLGNYPAAQQLFEQALATHQTIGDRRAEANTLYHLGFLHCRLNNHATAISLFRQALAILRNEIDDPWALAEALTYFGWVLIETGQFHQAREYLQETMRIKNNLEHEGSLIESAIHLGRVALAREDISLAGACARHAMDFITRQGVEGIEHPAMVFLTCYHILCAEEQTELAQSVLQEGQEYVAAQAAQIGNPALRAGYLNNIPENKALQELAARVEAA